MTHPMIAGARFPIIRGEVPPKNMIHCHGTP